MTSYFASVDDNIATDATAGVIKTFALENSSIPPLRSSHH